MNIIFTTISLALELVASPAFAGRFHLWEVQCLRTAGVLTSALYIFELIYRLKMRMPMIAHHFLTIIAISFTVTVFEYTQSMSYLCSAIIWLFQATTEQPTFIGLLGYRLDWEPRTVSRILKIASLQTFIFKSASAIALIAYWGVHQNYSYNSVDRAWTAMVFIIAIGLLLTQIWGSWVTFQIARRIERQPPTLSKANPPLNNSDLAIYQTIRSNLKEKDPHHPHNEVHAHIRTDSMISSSSTIDQSDEQRYRDEQLAPSQRQEGNRSKKRLTILPSFSFLHDDNGQRQISLLTESDYNKVDERIKQGSSISSLSPLLNGHNGKTGNNQIQNSSSMHPSTNESTHSGPDEGGLRLDPTLIPLPKSPSISPISTTMISRNNNDRETGSSPSPNIPLNFNFVCASQERSPREDGNEI
nr:uncharacterized protein I206_01151 [Kwoniella pini CBS 10737]OCF53844.1 hypothetical protein I206_01151 [Kwoniella pini CBS 10737]